MSFGAEGGVPQSVVRCSNLSSTIQFDVGINSLLVTSLNITDLVEVQLNCYSIDRLGILNQRHLTIDRILPSSIFTSSDGEHVLFPESVLSLTCGDAGGIASSRLTGNIGTTSINSTLAHTSQLTASSLYTAASNGNNATLELRCEDLHGNQNVSTWTGVFNKELNPAQPHGAHHSW